MHCVLGLKEESIYRRLLSGKDLMLDKAVAIAQNMQAAMKGATEISSPTSASTSTALYMLCY